MENRLSIVLWLLAFTLTGKFICLVAATDEPLTEITTSFFTLPVWTKQGQLSHSPGIIQDQQIEAAEVSSVMD